MDTLNLWEKWNVELKMRDRLYGGIPRNPDVLASWIRVGTGLENDSLSEAVTRIQKEIVPERISEENVEGIAEKNWTGFKSDSNGLYVEHRQVKAMLKEAANNLKEILKVKAFKSKIAETIFIDGDTHYGEGRIHLNAMEPSGFEERPIHAMTPTGPISALKRIDYVETPTISFTLKILRKPIVDTNKTRLWPSDYLPVLFDYASENGFGADRSQEKGKFEIVRLEKVEGCGKETDQAVPIQETDQDGFCKTGTPLSNRPDPT